MIRHGGFTLIEVMVSLVVLMVGMSAAFAIFMLGVNWTTRTKIVEIGYDTGFAVMEDASVLMESRLETGAPDNDDPVAQGWVNGFYIVREIRDGEGFDFGDGVFSRMVVVSVYHGGTDTDGDLVAQLTGKVIDR